MISTWRCKHCSHRNFLHWETCALCGSFAPAPPPEQPKKTGAVTGNGKIRGDKDGID